MKTAIIRRVLLVSTVLTASLTSAANGILASAVAGQLRGVARPSGGAEFLGIPYAQPPVGDLRWHEPAPMTPWTGVRDAQTFGAPCAQKIQGDWNRRDAETGKEDCLFLNVMTPVWPPKEKLPVMVWLHGGGNTGGTASSALYKDGTLVEHGVILVTVNYRLGVFGFFAHPQLTAESAHHASGNYGLLDQIAALRWVRDNIANFGGDPNNVTLFGQSAGAQDAGLLMTSPLAKGLFHRVIAESGSALAPLLPPLSAAEKSGERTAESLKAPAGDVLKYLRQISPQDVLSGLPHQDFDQIPMFSPILDGYVFTRSPAKVFMLGEEAPVPLMIGTTTREFGTSASPQAIRQWINAVTSSQSGKALALYGFAGDGKGATDPVYGSGADQWFADFVFRCPVTAQAAWHSAAHHPVFQYEFQRVIPGHEAEGSVHSADLPYVFGYYPKGGNISGKFNDTDFRISDQMEKYWTAFAKTGDPNSASSPNWPTFNPSESFLRFTNDGRALPTFGGLREPQCSLLREVIRKQAEASQ